MKMPEPVYPERIEEIKRQYDRMIESTDDETTRKMLEAGREMKIAEEIGRQRQEAIARGGELGERIKAENEAVLKEYKSNLSETDPEAFKKFLEAEEILKKKKEGELKQTSAVPARPRFCSNCGTPAGTGRFCTECGNKLF